MIEPTVTPTEILTKVIDGYTPDDEGNPVACKYVHMVISQTTGVTHVFFDAKSAAAIGLDIVRKAEEAKSSLSVVKNGFNPVPMQGPLSGL